VKRKRKRETNGREKRKKENAKKGRKEKKKEGFKQLGDFPVNC
jgi:hypothetical protein